MIFKFKKKTIKLHILYHKTYCSNVGYSRADPPMILRRFACKLSILFTKPKKPKKHGNTINSFLAGNYIVTNYRHVENIYESREAGMGLHHPNL